MTDPDDDPTPPRDPVPPAPTAPTSPTALHDILWFLDQARLRGYRVGPHIEYGGARLQVVDIRQAKLEGGAAVGPDVGIWEEHGFKEER